MSELKPCPLSCRQLKMMVGEPVWVVSPKRKEWCIVHSFHSDDVVGGGIIVTTRTSQKITLPYYDAEKHWWAYSEKLYDYTPCTSPSWRKRTVTPMAEYIEREATCGDCIHAEVCEMVPIFTEFSRDNIAYCKQFRNAADVVPVVRCFECKYQEDCFSQIGHWSRDSVLEQNNYEYHKLDFCSYGERRED